MGRRRKSREGRMEAIAKSRPSIPCLVEKCDGELRLTSLRGRWTYVCTNSPRCKFKHDAFQFGPFVGKPRGIPANRETIAMRREAHRWFDQVWEGEHAKMSRGEAYDWLAVQLRMTKKECHIGRFDIMTCQRVIDAVRIYLDQRGAA